MTLSYLDSSFSNNGRQWFEKTSSRRRSSFVNLSSNISNKKFHPLSSLLSPFEVQKKSSTLERSSKKTNVVQLHRPIYLAQGSGNIKKAFFYEKNDEFELVKLIDDDYLQVIHLRSKTECLLHRKHLRLDEETPLRLASNDRGVIQQCLFKYNVTGAYLIRRSKNEENSFVLSISQRSEESHTDDWHYLIRIDSKSNRFYFAQESQLKHLLFANFQELIRNAEVRRVIPFKCLIPKEIEFEDGLWQIPRRDLTLEYRIGKGEFGEVWRGSWKNGSQLLPVAIKRLHSLKSNSSSFSQEIETLKTLRNNFIVTLYGTAQDDRTLETFLITELMEFGDLKSFLKLSTQIPSEDRIISYASDICRGMSYLEQNFHIHRDLACRNLLLASEGKIIKIADFGFSTLVTKKDFRQRKEIYLHKVPIRWSAPEVLNQRNSYSIKSDVWSFGIVLIEIWLKGADPYPDEENLTEIRSLLQIGYVHRKPSKCSNQFYNRLIFPCLCFVASERPSFKSLLQLLQQWNEEKALYDRLNCPYVEFSS